MRTGAVAQGLIQVSQAVQLMGARGAGRHRPEVAQALVSLDADLNGFEKAATLQDGISGAP